MKPPTLEAVKREKKEGKKKKQNTTQSANADSKKTKVNASVKAWGLKPLAAKVRARSSHVLNWKDYH